MNGLSIQALTSALLKAEQKPYSLTHYKGRVNELERMEWSRVGKVLEAVPALALLAIHYYRGLPYNNFTLLGAPLASLLPSHGFSLPSPTFLLVFLAELQAAGRDMQITTQVKLKAGVMIGQPKLIFDFLDKTELGSSEVMELLAALLMANKLLLPMARVELLLDSPQPCLLPLLGNKVPVV